MADNYLEKQRELYEIRKAAWEKKKKYGIKKKVAPKKEATTNIDSNNDDVTQTQQVTTNINALFNFKFN